MATDVSSMAGAGMGMISAQKAQKAQEKLAKQAMKQQRLMHEESSATRLWAGQKVEASVDLARQNLMAGEQARLNVLGALGQPGSYGPSPGSTSGSINLGILKPTGLGGLYGQGNSPGSLYGSGQTSMSGSVTGADVALKGGGAWKGKKDWEVHGAELDPAAMAEEVKGTAAFRTVSRMVAETEQMINREGPLWDQLNNSVVGGIYESSAAFQRSAMEQVSRGMARGGSARRSSIQMAEAMRVQEQVNRQRTGQLWQAKMGLEQYRVTSAQQVTAFAQEWVNNTSGIRDNFTNALQSLQLFWSTTMAPVLAGASVGAQSATQQGIFNAGAGLAAAAATRSNAFAGMADAMGGAIEGVGGWMQEKGWLGGGGDGGGDVPAPTNVQQG